MTARKNQPTRRTPPPGWYHLQDAASIFGISPNTMTKWVSAGFVTARRPDGTRRLIHATEIRRVADMLRKP